MRLVCISDTHNQHESLALPDGDVLIHAGDYSEHGSLAETMAFAEWFVQQPHEHKILVPGNHDFLFEEDPATATLVFGETVQVLMDRLITVEGKRVYGAPWVPKFGTYAFMLRPDDIRERWKRIPQQVDILVTHGPPWGILDQTDYPGNEYEHVGCQQLLDAIHRRRPWPRVHVFGHIHSAHGVSTEQPFATGHTIWANVAISDTGWENGQRVDRGLFEPTIIDL